MRTEFATADSPPLQAVLQAHEPDEIGAVAVERKRDAAELVAAGSGVVVALFWSVTSPSTWPYLFCGHGSPRCMPMPQ